MPNDNDEPRKVVRFIFSSVNRIWNTTQRNVDRVLHRVTDAVLPARRVHPLEEPIQEPRPFKVEDSYLQKALSELKSENTSLVDFNLVDIKDRAEFLQYGSLLTRCDIDDLCDKDVGGQNHQEKMSLENFRKAVYRCTEQRAKCVLSHKDIEHYAKNPDQLFQSLDLGEENIFITPKQSDESSSSSDSSVSAKRS